MKTFVTLIFILMLVLKAWCQTEDRAVRHMYETDLHQIRQLEGTNAEVINYFLQTDLFFTTDTAYIIIIPPMKCSRCEGVINPFIYELKKADPDVLVMVMAFYPKSGALNQYLQERQFKADHTIASTDLGFLENFYFSTDDMQVPYITKFDIETGDLIIGKSTLGLEMNKEFVKWFRAYDNTLTKETKTDNLHDGQQLSIPEIKINNMDLKIINPLKEVVLGEEEGYPISQVLFPAFNGDITYFSFMDELSFKIYLYQISITGLTFSEAIAPGEKEEKLFIHQDVNDTLYTLLKKMNIINSMFFSSTFIDDSIIITSSLPNIFFEDTAKDKLAYYNRSTYLYRGLEGDSIVRFMIPENLPDTNLTYEHLNTQFIDQGQLICLPVSKGWPVSGTETLDQVEAEDNPFKADFYKHAPMFAVYDKQGKFIQYFGELASDYVRRKLGYSYSQPLIRSDEGIYWYADKYTGLIEGVEKLTQKKPDKQITAFEVPDYQPNINPKQDPLAYIKDFKKVYTQSMLDFKVYHDTVHVVIQHEDFFYYKKFSTKGRLLSVRILPTVYDNMHARHFLFNINDQHQWLIGIYESAELTSLYFFK